MQTTALFLSGVSAGMFLSMGTYFAIDNFQRLIPKVLRQQPRENKIKLVDLIFQNIDDINFDGYVYVKPGKYGLRGMVSSSKLELNYLETQYFNAKIEETLTKVLQEQSQ